MPTETAKDYFVADFERAMKRRREFGPTLDAACEVESTAKNVAERIRRGSLGVIEADIARLKLAVNCLTRVLAERSNTKEG